MRRPLSLISAVILLIAYSGCFWDRGGERYGEHNRGGYGEQGGAGYGEHNGGGYGERDRQGYSEHDRGGHDGDRHDDRRDLDDHR